MSINVNDKNLGHATAYAYYKAGGGTMTEAEFTEFMADFGTASQTAVEAAQAALASKNAAQTAATTATNKASEATTAATTATTKAGEASTSASTATSAKDTAVSASQTATTKATEATTAAATAVSAKDDAVSANTAAQSAKTAAQTAQTGAETAAASVQSSAAQIQTNADDISELKEDTTQLMSDLSGVIDRVDYKLERKAIYIYPTYSFLASTDSTIRVSTTPIYVAAGESVRIKGYGFGKYARNLSNDGETISAGNGFVTSDTVDISYYGPIWVRLTFAFADDSDITPDDVNIKITKGYSGVVNKYVVDAFGKVVNTPEYLGNNIVATNKNMYVRNNNGVLQLSKTGGESWNSGIDVTAVGLIKTYHLFDNGCIAFFTHQKAYYSEDWATYHEADVYEADGVTPYAPSAYDNFTLSRDNKTRMYVGTQDAFVFGNYGITDEANTRRIIWATLDNGHTYKVIYEFNIDGAYRIRHIHNVIYSPDNGYFLCAVGDSSSESRVIKISYNADTSVWSFESLGNGLAFKWAGIAFYGAYVYFCYDNTPGKVCRCRFSEISDVSKHETILDNLPNDTIGLYIGERGDMIVTLSSYRTGVTNSPFESHIDERRIYYSVDRENFVNFIGTNPTNYREAIYYGFMPLNDDGRIMTGTMPSPTSLDSWNRLPSVSLDAMVKQYGYPNAFKPYDRSWEVVPVIDVECDDISVEVGNSTTITPKLYPWNASSLAFEIVDFNTSIISVSGATITGKAAGTTTAKVRSRTNYEAYAEITVTVA